ILQVSSREKRTGLEKQIAIDNATARFEKHELDAARERIAALIDVEPQPAASGESSERREATQARALVEKAERLLEGANADDREDLVDRIESVRDALSKGDPGPLERAVAELTDLIYYLES
ncbi:MAG: heat-shock protein Hsp70, partial [Chromatiaceae bacterium]